MLDLADRLHKEQAVIKEAPFSFFITGLVILIIVAGVFQFLYHTSLSDAQEETNHWRDTAGQWQSDAAYWKDLAQSPVTGVTPNSVQPPTSGTKPVVPSKPSKAEHPSPVPNSATKLSQNQTCANGPCVNGDNGTATVNNFGAVPRELTPVQATLLAQSLGPPAPGFGGVYCVIGDSDSCKFANQLIAILRSQGWHINGLVVGAFTNPPSGLVLVASAGDVMSPPDGLKQTYEAFRKAGIDIRAVKSDSEPKGSFFLLVGDNPSASQ